MIDDETGIAEPDHSQKQADPQDGRDFEGLRDGIDNGRPCARYGKKDEQDIVEAIIKKFGKRSSVLFTTDDAQNEASIGPYRFSRDGFQALIRYVWQGGYPRWKDAQPPDYVLAMKDRIHTSDCPLFQGLDLSF